MADVITENNEIGNTKQELIASLVQRELAFNAKLAPYFTDLSVFAVPGAKSISFPKLTSFTVQDRSEGQKGDAQALTSSLDQLDLNINAYVSWIVDAMTKKQANINVEMEFAKRAASAHGRYVDSKIIELGLRIGAYNFQNVGGDVDVTYANLLDMFEKYMTNDGLQDQGSWIFSVAQHTAAMNLTELKQLDTFGEPVVRNGVIQQIMGMPVIIHNGLASKELFLAGKESVGYGFQSGPAMDEQKAIGYGVGATQVAVDQLFGIKPMQTGEKSVAAGKSPLILGLND
jgi:hypothetical protein